MTTEARLSHVLFDDEGVYDKNYYDNQLMIRWENLDHVIAYDLLKDIEARSMHGDRISLPYRGKYHAQLVVRSVIQYRKAIDPIGLASKRKRETRNLLFGIFLWMPLLFVGIAFIGGINRVIEGEVTWGGFIEHKLESWRPLVTTALDVYFWCLATPVLLLVPLFVVVFRGWWLREKWRR